MTLDRQHRGRFYLHRFDPVTDWSHLAKVRVASSSLVFRSAKALVRDLVVRKQLTETHNYAQYVRMAAIDHKGLTKAMDLALVTPKQLAEATGMSLTYVCDITAGRRTLKRNPELRKKIAVALNVPQHWIEHAEQVAS